MGQDKIINIPWRPSRWDYRYTVLTLSMFAFFATMVARLAISPLIPSIIAEFNVTNTSVGVALTGMWMAYATTQFPSGLIADKYGERRVILVAVGGTATASLLLAVTPIFPMFVIFTVVLGGVAGFHYSVATTLLTRIYEDVGLPIGIHNSGAPAAGLLAPVASAWVGVRYGWRPAVAIGAVVALPVFVLFAFRVRPTEPRRPDERLRDRLQFQLLSGLLGRKPILFTVYLAILCAFVWQGVASFLPTFLIEYRDQSTTFAGLVFSIYFITHGITQIAVGAISDRYGKDVTISLCMIVGVIGLLLLTTVSGIIAVLAGAILLGTGMSWSPAVLSRFMENLSEDERNVGFGLVRTIYMFVASLGSVIVGLLADLAGWLTSFWFLLALLVIVFLSLVSNAVVSDWRLLSNNTL